MEFSCVRIRIIMNWKKSDSFGKWVKISQVHEQWMIASNSVVKMKDQFLCREEVTCYQLNIKLDTFFLF